MVNIGYDPRSGMKIRTGFFSSTKQSPVSGLVHDIGHAARYLAKTAVMVPSVSGGFTFPEPEEDTVNDIYEKSFAAAIGDPTREKYKDGIREVIFKCPFPGCL